MLCTNYRSVLLSDAKSEKSVPLKRARQLKRGDASHESAYSFNQTEEMMADKITYNHGTSAIGELLLLFSALSSKS